MSTSMPSTAMSGGQDSAPQAEVPYTKDRIAREISTLVELFELLCGRLTPVLSNPVPEPEAPTKPMATEPVQTVLANELSEFAIRLNIVNENIRDITSRLEL